jgi:hypothetical protein
MAIDVKPLFVRWIKLEVTDAQSVAHNFECAVTQAGLTSTGGDPVSLNTLCPEGSFSEATERTWQLTVTGVQDVESAESFQLFLLEHDGEQATFVYYPKTDKSGTPMGRGFTGTVTLAPPDNVGNSASGAYATFTATLPLQGKYSMVDENGDPIPNKASAKPGDVYPTEPTVTASDATNAAKLTGLGYVVDPATVPWSTGDKMTVNGYDFSWDEAAVPAAWAPGTHVLLKTKAGAST